MELIILMKFYKISFNYPFLTIPKKVLFLILFFFKNPQYIFQIAIIHLAFHYKINFIRTSHFVLMYF